MTDAGPLGSAEATFIAAARSGDTARFALITERRGVRPPEAGRRLAACFPDTVRAILLPIPQTAAAR